MGKSRQDHDLESFVDIPSVGSARRVVGDASSPIPVTPIAGLVLPKYDTGHGAKPTATREVYTYFLAAVLVATLTIDYEDETKKFVTDWVLT